MYAYSFRVGVESRNKLPATRSAPVLRQPGGIVAVTPAQLRSQPLGLAASAGVAGSRSTER
jgi:hypothetical protein